MALSTVALGSDIHVEFGQYDIKNTKQADVLLLAGDICIGADFLRPDDKRSKARAKEYREFFAQACAEFPQVIYITGNHEFYHGEINTITSVLKSELACHSNLSVLDNESVTINDVTFVGGTLWTNMNNNCPLTEQFLTYRMNDFRIITDDSTQCSKKVPVYKEELGKDGYQEVDHYRTKMYSGTLTPAKAAVLHNNFIQYLSETIVPGNKYVVVGHHAPSKQSTHPRYATAREMNGGYSSDLDAFILAHPEIALWVHGHTHEKFDYMIGNTHIACNPRGYIGHERNADNFELQYINIQ
jgi:Icc-related predicted phosphoesterase